MNNKQNSQRGHSLAKLLVLLALSSIFLFALGSLATAIKLANKNLKNKKNLNALANIMNNTYIQSDVPCKSEKILENVILQECQNQDMALNLSIKEIYADE